MEAVSIHQYVSHHQKQDPIFELTSMGCSLPKPINWLAASPDGIVHDSVQIKNPFYLDKAFCLEVDRVTKERRLK